MSLSELLGSLIQAGLTASSNDRLKNSLGAGSGGGGGLLESLASMLGGAAGGGGGGLLESLGSILGSGRGGGGGLNDLGGLLGSVLGEVQQTPSGEKKISPWEDWGPLQGRSWEEAANPSAAPWAAG